MKKFAILLFLLCFYSQLHAQLIDTIRASFHYKPKFYMNLSSYKSVVRHQSAIFTDLVFGISLNKRVYFGAGITGLNSNIVTSKEITDSTGSYVTNARLKMSLFLFTAEYVFSKNYPWTFSVLPFKLATGKAYYEYFNHQNGALTKLDGDLVVVYQPEVTASYNVFKWIGLGSSVGYRFTIYSPVVVGEDLNSFTYSFGVKLFLGALYESVFPNGIHFKKENKKVE